MKKSKLKSIDSGVARIELEAWLDQKRVPGSKRTEDILEAMQEAVEDGRLIIVGTMTDTPDPIPKDWEPQFEATGELRQVLLEPIRWEEESRPAIEELEYKARLRVKEVNFKGVSAKDADGRLACYISALTGKARGILGNLDTTDNSLAQTIATFFL